MLTKILCCFDSLKSFSEVVVQRCSYEEVVAKCKATLLKSHVGMGVFL